MQEAGYIPPISESEKEPERESSGSLFVVPEIASNLLLNVTSDGYPIYIDDQIAYEMDSGEVIIAPAYSNASLASLPIDEKTGAVVGLPINEHTANQFAEKFAFIEKIEDLQPGEEQDWQNMGFFHPIDVQFVEDKRMKRFIIVPKLSPEAVRTTMEIGVVDFGKFVPLPRSFTESPTFCYLTDSPDGGYDLYFFSERDTAKEGQEDNKRLTSDAIVNCIFAAEKSLLDKQTAEEVRKSVENVTQETSVVSEEEKKVLFDGEAITTKQANTKTKQDIFSQVYSGAWESYDHDFLKWVAAQKQIKEADVIVAQGDGGIGDTVYQILAAQAIANEFPEKRIIFHCRGFFSNLIDQSKLPSNFQIDTSEEGVLVRRKKIGLKEEKVFVLNLNISSTEVWKYEEKPTKKNFTIFNTLRKVFYSQHITYLNDRVDRKNIGKRNGLLTQWYKLFKREESLPFDRGHYSQVVIYNSVLRRLLGLDEQISLKENAISKPEIKDDTPKFDVVIVYDALSNGRAKVPMPVQLIELIRKLQTDGMSVGVVQGKDNPGDLVYIQKVCPEVGIIKGSLTEVLSGVMNSKVAVIAETGIGHIVNQILESEENLPDDKKSYQRVPKLLSLIGADSGYYYDFFALSKGESLVSSSAVATIDPGFIYERVKANLSDQVNSDESSNSVDAQTNYQQE